MSWGGIYSLGVAEGNRRRAADKALSEPALRTALGKRAKDLTDAEALDLLVALHDIGEITLPDGVKRDAAGKVTLPVAGAKTKGVVGTTMRGVTYAKANDSTRPKGGAEGFDPIASFSPTPAFAIVLYKLATMLADKWQVTTVVVGGIGAGGGQQVTDSHVEGRSIDFYGVVRAGGAAIDVRRDWFTRPVYLPSFLPLVPQPHPDRAVDSDDPWGNATVTCYRLATSPDPQDVTPRQFFADVYRFAAEQTTTVTTDPSAANFDSPGGPLTQGHVWHPDSPIAGSFKPRKAGRRPHHDHMHFQLGHDL